MESIELFSNELVFLNKELNSSEELFDWFNVFATEKGIVTERFLRNIKKREAEYPTGIQTEFIGVAIPHTDPENIIKPFVAVIKPTNPILFEPMGMGEHQIKAEFIFILGVKNDGGQVVMLQNLMNLLMNKEAVKLLCLAINEEEVLKVIKNYM
ncbi:PTS sugar transporter subunit IIA [Erysipelothrix rhusiopathiae]|nr:PTS sugar transporter subunit IIA [Erysipelothrix rhusiopathiae]MDE8055259.1 PTS sugar transporter subunit IIA [Erysipelothrix rhusiopathiae]MDE8092131.1 PTS sugar transporter subunit IIA [Erysipelothrix rhusiopathiae]MDE8098120.1 PTS sugar transporter subunit IIA [Erysipelothrix rhusiopathiae]MDE8103378.1 PTS sugar transporter subunit IIA [Erysipelothrix rhusiopathiae]